ncbi:DNA endonuclease rbbp8, partial [Globisporangium splendens]
MAEDWQRERAALFETVRRQQQDAAKLAKRFKLLQQTLVAQQELLDRYQKALEKSGCALPAPPSSVTASASSVTVEPHQKQITALNTARDAEIRVASGAHNDSLSGVCGKEEICAEEAPIKQVPNVAVKRERVSLSSPEKQRDVASKPEKTETCTSLKAATPPSRHAPMTGSRVTKDASWISRKADFHRDAVLDPKQVVQTDVASDASTTSAATRNYAASVATASPLSRKRKLGERAPTWAQEKQRMREAGIRIQGPRFRDDKAATLSPSRAAACAKSATALSPSQSSDEKEHFQYVEVVRNRDARAALPGHDCVECRKYYEALDGVISADDVARQKAACSRHRARFEPYNTPDGFWRLSFPDSVPASQSP